MSENREAGGAPDSQRPDDGAHGHSQEGEIIKEDESRPMLPVGMVGGVPGGVPGGQAGGVLGGIIGGSGGGTASAAEGDPARIRVGGNVAAANLIRQVMPVYPQIAKTAHIPAR